jgi:pimeloyl-ACP methyl ester carboxylesterase
MMRQRLISTVLPLVVLLLVVVPGCAPVTVRHTTLQSTYTTAVQADVISTGELSQLTQQVLRMAALPTATQDPFGTFQALDRESRTDQDQSTQVALVEFALWQALQQETTDPTAAADWYLLAAARSYEFLFARAPSLPAFFDLRSDRLRIFYVRAVVGFLQEVQRSRGSLAGYQRTIAGEPYVVDIASGPGLFDPTTFDELPLAAELLFEGLTNRHRRFGLGIALVGFRKNRLEQPADRFFARAGTSYAVTSLLVFDPPSPGVPGPHVAHLCFYDAMQVDAIDIRGVRVPLAADFTAPLGLVVSRTRLKSIGLAQTLSAEKWLDEAGFYMGEPFDPQKIPLITVHGLLSSPITWLNLQNDLMGDPEIRQHYQIWHFFYPAGLPIAFSAHLFRDKLQELYQFFDPHNQYPALHNSVIIAHSMGGLLAHTVISDSGDQLWHQFFHKAPDEMKLSAEVKQALDQALTFQHSPFIRRIIFVAVPHRGSALSENFAGEIGRMLITTPKAILESLRLVLAQVGTAMAPEEKAYLVEEDPSSIRALSPNNPLIKALAQIAIDRNIPFHSIIGDRGLGNGVQGSDGVVPYTSAHLEGAESELIVPTGHSAHIHPLAVREVKRILKLHLQQSGVPRS